MNTELRFGSANKSDKKPQSVYLRIRHNNLYWNKSLKIKIDAEDWNFKKREIIIKKSFNNPIRSQHLKEVSERLNGVYYSMKFISEKFLHTNKLMIDNWVKEKNRKAFIELCEDWYAEYQKTKEVAIQPFLVDVMQNYIDKRLKKSPTKFKDRYRRLNDYIINIRGFELFWEKRIKTNKLSQELLDEEMIPFFRDEYEKGCLSSATRKDGSPIEFSGIGLKDNTIKQIIGLIKQTAKKEKKNFEFHSDIFDEEFQHVPEETTKLALTPNQLKLVLEYSDHANFPSLDNRIWFFKVMYYGCFRINEVFASLKGKTPQQVWENNIEKLKDANGNLVYHWNCSNFKQKKFHFKKIPMFNELGDLLFNGFENAEQGIFPESFPKFSHEHTYRKALRKICNKVGITENITPHALRRSFLRHLKKNQSLNHSDLMQYSGHQTERALLIYLDDLDNNVPTSANLNQKTIRS